MINESTPEAATTITLRDEIRLSVALVTRNRPESLERTLSSLREQSVQPWEVVVSDDSDEQYRELVQALCGTYGCVYITGPRRGLYANRNHAAIRTRGTHIRSMDDDQTFPAEHIRLCVEASQAEPTTVWTIGEIVPNGGAYCFPGLLSFPGQLNARGVSQLPEAHGGYWGIADGASIYPEGVFRQGIRFCEDFKFGASYLEFGSLLNWLGFRMKCLSSTYVIHHFVAGKRSFESLEIDLSSRFFAMLCYSLVYQPTHMHQIVTGISILKWMATRPRMSVCCLRSAYTAFAERKKRVRNLKGTLCM